MKELEYLIMSEVLEKYIDKEINIVMNGSNSVTCGKLLYVGDDFFVIKTLVSNKHYCSLDELSNFYCSEDVV